MAVSTEEYLTRYGLVKQEHNLFHYTNVDALKKIMDSSTFLATHMQYMNDWSEYEQGYGKLVKKLKETIQGNQAQLSHDVHKALSKRVEDLQNECPKTPLEYQKFIKEKKKTNMEKVLPEVYAVSFCRQPDLLNQWINYARESGVCIEFDFRGFEFICPDITEAMYDWYEGDIDKKLIYKNCRPMQIVYDEKKEAEVMTEAISSYLQRVSGQVSVDIEDQWWAEMEKVFSIVPFFKHSAFSPEEEARIAVRPIALPLNYKTPRDGKQSEMFRAQICHIESNHILKPRLKLQWRSEGTVGEPPNYPVKSITVGPGVNQQMTYQSIIHYIEKELKSIPGLTREKREKIKVGETSKMPESRFQDSYVTEKGIVVRKSNIPYIY